MKKFRNNGAIGAILDEYEKALQELRVLIATISEKELKRVIDTKTKDVNCISIQTILSHVISAGYNYVIAIRNSQGEKIAYRRPELLDQIQEYDLALKKMFAYNEQLFNDYPAIELEQLNNAKKIKVEWGQQYDTEQLLEHAIVHILRHRRQIERFMSVYPPISRSAVE